MPLHASQVYANNLVNLLELMMDKEGRFKIDPTDEVIAGVLVCHGGQVVHPCEGLLRSWALQLTPAAALTDSN